MSANYTIAVVGDGVVDEIRRGTTAPTRHPGGGALNVARGVATLGGSAALVYNAGDDQAGRWLSAELLASGVEPLVLKADVTGLAQAHFADVNSEPEYRFSDAIVHREYQFDDRSARLLSRASVVAITAFPLDDPRSVDGYLEQLPTAEVFSAVDPNPRLTLLHDITRYQLGFERIARRSNLVKISDADIALLYGNGHDISRISDHGAVVVTTHGAGGATLHLPGNSPVHFPAADLEGPLVDTLGAGDATLATLLVRSSNGHGIHDEDHWHAALSFAMEVAAATCTTPGGSLTLPTRPVTLEATS